MASPNSRPQWTSMFRSKHGSQMWQSQADVSGSPPSLVSGATAAHSFKSSFSSVGPDLGRSTETKPRWNPRPEQIRILEALFNSGMMNPPRDEIPRIRMRLQEYGQVGDSNVFYWFQNRKSRSKNKLRSATAARAAPARACAPARNQNQAAPPYVPPTPPNKQIQPQQQLLFSPVAPTSSSSSSDRSSGSSKPVKTSASQAMDLLSPIAAACHQQMRHQLGLDQGQPVLPAAPQPPAPITVAEPIPAADVEPIFLQYPQQGHCLPAGELAAILGAQYMPAVQQTPAASMLSGLYNELSAAPTTTSHRSSGWPSGLGQHWPSGADQQLGLAKISEPLNASLGGNEEDFTKLGLLQYGLGITTAPATSSAAVWPLPTSPDQAAVTIATAPAPAGLTSLFATAATTADAVTYNHLQGPAADDDVGFEGAAAGGTARGAAVVCFAGTSAACNVPATHLDVKLYFGGGAVLFRCSGDRAEPLLVDETGHTIEPLQHGAVYYCVLI
uniref:Uncharacterized protein n=1 Tax=Avena sativa TaxID=4498 RepID=A0ACD5VJI2_AVESA